MKNSFGIEIQECCASCFFAMLDNSDMRQCTEPQHVSEGDESHSKDHSCPRWRCRQGFLNAGSGGGKVKPYKYFQWLFSGQTINVPRGVKPYDYWCKNVRPKYSRDELWIIRKGDVIINSED